MNGARLLVIDRDPVLVSDITQILTKAGYSVLELENKNDVLSNSWMVKPDLAIFEASDDEKIFLDLAKELYQQHEIPFIVLSASEDRETINKAVKYGALSYLLKPISIKQLIPIIESSLRRAQDIQRLQDAEHALSTAIQTARVISAAIGIMMERFRLTNKVAFEMLRSEARSNHKKIIEIANEILTAAETVNQFNIINNSVKD